MCKIKKFRFIDRIRIEFEIFQIGNLKFGIEIGYFDFELCEFGSNSVIGFFKFEISILNSQFEIEIKIGIQNYYFDFKFIFHIYIILYIYVI